MSATLPAGPVYPTCGEPGCRCGDEAHQRVLRAMRTAAVDAEIAAHNRRVALEQAALSAFTVTDDERTWTREVGR